MKKKKDERGRIEECKELDWVELSEKLNAKDGPDSSAIVNETISQIVSEEYLKVDTSDTDSTADTADPFYAYDRKRAKKRPAPKNPAQKKPVQKKPVQKKPSQDLQKRSAVSAPSGDEDHEKVIRRSVDEKIIIRSEELKKKRRTGNRTGAEKAGDMPEKKKKAGKADAAVTDDSFRHAKGLEKYRRMGILPTRKDGPSEFRKKSAKWRYEDIPEDVSEGLTDISSSAAGSEDEPGKLSPTRLVAIAMTAVLVISSVLATSVYADYRGEQNLEMAMANLPVFEDDASSIDYNGDLIEETENFELEDAAAPADTVEGKMLSLVLTSVEKDLKVKLVDEDDTLVKGIKWGINVTDEDDNESTYEDEDEDGIIHLTGINAGDYSVSIADTDDLAGYVYPTVGQKVSVKAKVEYKVIANIRDEIKKESEVNAAAEDNGNKAADVETGTAPADTVEFVESSVEENGEVYEEAEVDLSKTEIIASLYDRVMASLGNMARTASGIFSENGILAMNLVSSADHPAVTAQTSLTAEETDKEENKEEEESKEEEEEEPGEEEEEEPKEEEEEEPKEEEEEEEEEEETEEEEEELTEDEEEEESDIIDLPTPTPKPKDPKDIIEPTPTPRPLPEIEDQEYKDDAQLYDSEKNVLYVYEDGEYRRAKYRDYRSGEFSRYYKKVTGYVYTGWQNLDGRTYYFTKDHEKVTGDQVIGGVSYHFNEDGSLDTGSGVLGIDVSKYQPSINWSSVKASGVDFAIIRCGYRGASTGALIEDPCFRSHIKGAKSAGLKVGVYFFSTALNETEAVEEASMCAELCGGYGLNLPVFLDVESSGRPGYNGLSVSQRTSNIRAFCETVASAGYTPGLYANKTWLTEKIDTSALSCKIWLAQYRAEGPTYTGRYDIWQYTSKGHVDGIPGNVDMNKGFMK